MKMKSMLISLACIGICNAYACAKATEAGHSDKQQKPLSIADCTVPSSNITPAFQHWLDGLNSQPYKYWQPYEFATDRYSQIEVMIAKDGTMLDATPKSSCWSVDGDVSALEACWSIAPLTKRPEQFSVMPSPNYVEEDMIPAVIEFHKKDVKELFTGAIDYFKHNPKLKNKQFAVHTIPLSILDRYPSTFSKVELSSEENVLTFPKDSYLYISSVKAYFEHWQKFIQQHPKSSREEILDFANKLTNKKLFQKK